MGAETLNRSEAFQPTVAALGLVSLHLFPTLACHVLRCLRHAAKLDVPFAAPATLAAVGFLIDGHGAVGAHKLYLLAAHA